MTTEPGDTTSSARGFRWDNVVFKVENEVFCVPKHEFINNSPMFKDMYLVGNAASGEGTTEKEPIVLEGCAAKDFEALLMILYPSMNDMESGKYQLTKEQWDSALRLSRPWEMTKVRQLAIKTLSSAPFALTPMEKVTLAREHKVTSWLVEGLTRLTLSDPRISRGELEESVGLRTAFRIQGIQFDNLNPWVHTTTPHGVSTVLSVASVECFSCFKPYLPDSFGCHSCSKILDPKENFALYIRGGYNISARGMEMKAMFNLKHLLCRSCNNEAVLRTINCKACPQAVGCGNNAYAALGSFPQPVSSIEAMVREEFKDEINDYDT